MLRDLSHPQIVSSLLHKLGVVGKNVWGDRPTFENYQQVSAVAGSVLNATSTELTPFKAAGGKLLMWHGWADPALSALVTTDYYESVAASDDQVEDYFRFFLMPGVLHCAGGPGPWMVDYLTTLENWVEKGQAPDQMTAYFANADSKPEGSRPLCAYPKRAIYNGAGDERQAQNFTCAK